MSMYFSEQIEKEVKSIQKVKLCYQMFCFGIGF